MIQSKSFTAILSALTCAVLFSPAALSQLTQTWNLQNRADAERAISAGVTQLANREIATAIGAFERASQTDPNDAAAPMMLGMALAVQGKYQEALNALQRAYSLQPSAEILNDTGWVYYLQHDYDAAMTSWNRALKLNPKLCQLNGNIGFALARKGRFTDAEAQFQKLVTCKPQSNYGYQGLATVYYLRGNLSQARDAANRAMAQPYGPIVLLLAKLDALQGDKTNAVKRAQQSNSMTKKDPERSMTEIGVPTQHDFFWDPLLVDSFDNGNMLIARLQNPSEQNKQAASAKQSRAAEQVQGARTALQTSPNDLFLLRSLALALAANGDYGDASTTFKQVLDVCPQCNVDLLHLARNLAFQGNPTEATAAVEQFKRQQPGQQLSPAFANIGQEPVEASKTLETGSSKAKKIGDDVKPPKAAKSKATKEGKSPEPTVIPATEF